MNGAIVGDILGSIYESWLFQDSINDLNFNIFSSACIFTDDTCLTAAIADAILTNTPYEQKLCEWFHKYPNRGYGARFVDWANDYKKDPTLTNDSFGNGAMMRVSPIAYAFDDLDVVLKEADKSGEYTHNSDESMRGTRAIATAIFLARTGESKDTIKNHITSKYGYNLNNHIEHIRQYFDHRTTRCSVTCPQAISIFLQGNDYEDTIRKAIYTKGDCDTIAAMSGAIAHAYYKTIPDQLLKFAELRLPSDILQVRDSFMLKYNLT